MMQQLYKQLFSFIIILLDAFLLTEQFASELVIQTILFEDDKHLEIDKNEEILNLVIFQHLKKIKEIKKKPWIRLQLKLHVHVISTSRARHFRVVDAFSKANSIM
jgi:hypothetical protein